LEVPFVADLVGFEPRRRGGTNLYHGVLRDAKASAVPIHFADVVAPRVDLEPWDAVTPASIE
jgi:hypothetical protein